MSKPSGELNDDLLNPSDIDEHNIVNKDSYDSMNQLKMPSYFKREEIKKESKLEYRNPQVFDMLKSIHSQDIKFNFEQKKF